MTVTRTLGRFVWRELFTDDVQAAKAFYGELFGWAFEDRPMGDWSYVVGKKDGREIVGLMDVAHMPEGTPPVPTHWALYVSVDDVDARAKRVAEAGGQVLGDCHDIPGVGRFAMTLDPQGAGLNLFHATAGDPPDVEAVEGEFCFENLASSDPASSVAFYEQVVGWEAHGLGDGVTVFARKAADGSSREVASVGQAPDGRSRWSPFMKVADVRETAARVKAAGGAVHLEHVPVPGVGAFGVVSDPTGGAFFLLEPVRP